MLTVDITGLGEISTAFAKLVPKVQGKALTRLAKAVHDDVEQAIDRHTKTGALLQSLRWDKHKGYHYVYNDPQRAPYATFVHWGTKPHLIKPNKKKALRWPSGGSGFVFAKFVKHPGHKGDPWFVDAHRAAPQPFARIIQQLHQEPL